MDVFKKSFHIALIIGLISGVGITISGHTQAQHLMESQPMKMAASEGLWEDSGDPAAWSAFAIIDEETKRNSFEINIPYALSFLAYSKIEGSVPGMNTLQAEYEATYGEGNYIPPVNATFWSFRIMVGAGMLMILLSAVGLLLSYRQKLESSKFYLQAMVWLIAFPFLANTAGWVMTEIGRQPWTVFGLMTTSAAVSPNVSVQALLFSLIAFTAVYAILAIVLVYLFLREIRRGVVYSTAEDQQVSIDPFDKGAYQ